MPYVLKTNRDSSFLLTETSVLVLSKDILNFVNNIVETIPNNEFKHRRGVTSYHPKRVLKIVLCVYTQSVFFGRK